MMLFANERPFLIDGAPVLNGIAVVAKAGRDGAGAQGYQRCLDQPPRHLRQGAAGLDRRVRWRQLRLIRRLIAATAAPGLVRTGMPGTLRRSRSAAGAIENWASMIALQWASAAPASATRSSCRSRLPASRAAMASGTNLVCSVTSAPASGGVGLELGGHAGDRRLEGRQHADRAADRDGLGEHRLVGLEHGHGDRPRHALDGRPEGRAGEQDAVGAERQGIAPQACRSGSYIASVRSGASARSRLRESSSRFTRSGSGQSWAKAVRIGSTAAGVAWIRAMRVMAARTIQPKFGGCPQATGSSLRAVR